MGLILEKRCLAIEYEECVWMRIDIGKAMLAAA